MFPNLFDLLNLVREPVQWNDLTASVSPEKLIAWCEKYGMVLRMEVMPDGGRGTVEDGPNRSTDPLFNPSLMAERVATPGRNAGCFGARAGRTLPSDLPFARTLFQP